MNASLPVLHAEGLVQAEINGCLGLITLNRPQALNALSLAMIRDLTGLLSAWAADEGVRAVVIRGMGREGKPPAFCAGGDIRFFHACAIGGDTAALDAFFTEEYALNHLIHRYTKPYIALMDGIVMGGGMGISQGARLRVLSEHSKLAMPETGIGLFPDVGGGWFLAQCPGHVGEWLALTGQALGVGDALDVGLGDVYVPAAEWPQLWASLSSAPQDSAEHVVATVMARAELAPPPKLRDHREAIDHHFGQPTLAAIMSSLAADASAFAQEQLAALRQRSPLMMAVTLEQLRRARAGMSLAEDLRMERVLVHHCFHMRPGSQSETVEGIRALAVDKDHAPRWRPSRVEDVTPEMVHAFFQDPWPDGAHPLHRLA